MLKRLLHNLLSILTGRKALYAAVTVIMESIRATWPDVPLPPIEVVVGLGGALIAGHTVTDVAQRFGEGKAAAEAVKQRMVGLPTPRRPRATR
jgi:hypothetical protein